MEVSKLGKILARPGKEAREQMGGPLGCGGGLGAGVSVGVRSYLGPAAALRPHARAHGGGHPQQHHDMGAIAGASVTESRAGALPPQNPRTSPARCWAFGATLTKATA